MMPSQGQSQGQSFTAEAKIRRRELDISDFSLANFLRLKYFSQKSHMGTAIKHPEPARLG